MNSKSKPNIDDVARRAAVSTATVSRALNAPDSVREATLLRVRAAIDELGYSPNFGARALAANRTNLVGAVIPTMDNSIFAAGIQVFQETLSASGYTLIVSSTGYQAELEEQQIRKLVDRGCDALLLIGEARDARVYDFIRRRGIPYVIAWNVAKDPRHNFVGFDNKCAGRNIAQHVLDQGHEHIGILAGITDGNDRAMDRLAGMKSVLGDHALAVNIREVAYKIDTAGDAFEVLVNDDPRITAVLCGNDVIAAGAVVRARALGIAVPEQISICGFDDIELSRILAPALTTVHVPHRQMGRRAAEILIDALGPAPTLEETRIVMDSYLVVRESVRNLR